MAANVQQQREGLWVTTTSANASAILVRQTQDGTARLTEGGIVRLTEGGG